MNMDMSVSQGVYLSAQTQKIAERLKALEQEVSGGATALVALILNNKLYIANVGMYTHMRTHAHARTDTQTHRQTHSQTHTHARTHTYTRTHARTHAHTHRQTDTHTDRHIHTHTHTHTQTHRQTHSLSHTHTHTQSEESNAVVFFTSVCFQEPTGLFSVRPPVTVRTR